MKTILKHYIIKVIEKTNMGDETLERLFFNVEDAQAYYHEQLEDLIQMTIEDNELSSEEAEEYRDNINEDYYSNIDWVESAKDPEQKWTIGIIEYSEEVTIKPEKLNILTHCAAEQNYTPLVFKSKKEAKKEMDRIVDDLIYERDTDGEVIDQYSDDYEIYENSATIYYDDDTDCLQIFEVEVKK